jgi:hypothetical protein
MHAGIFQTPVALIVFNRPQTTQRVFDAVASVRPSKLLVVADGPRASKPDEESLCSQVREIVRAVDWPCELLTNFSKNNLGCQERVISGLDWVFSEVEEAIILEDDCLPSVSFFPFCQELLEKYRGDDRVASISGTNLVERYVNIEDSYFFSQLGGIWGWATWRSAWFRYDRQLKDWPKLRRENMLSEIFDRRNAVAYWTGIFDAMHENRGPNTWDYQWLYTRLKDHALTIVPRVNLIANIGFGIGSTHTRQVDPRLTPSTKTIEFPLRHPSSFIPLRSVDRHIQELFTASFLQLLSGKICRVAARLGL